MIAVFRHALGRFKGQILGWGIALSLLGLYVVSFYETFAEQQEQFEQLLKNYPPEMMAFLGDLDGMFTPEGYLGVEFFSYMPMVIGVFAVLAGSGLLASDEENGIMDLLLAHPVSRTGLFAGRALALVTATLAVVAIIWLGFVVALRWSPALSLSWAQMAMPLLALLAQLLLFGAVALLLSMLLPSRRVAAMVAGLLLVASFFLTSLARVNADLKPIARISPLNYYQSGDAINGLNGGWFAGLLAVAALCCAIAWWCFLKRDIRVAGEGSWRLPLPSRRRAAASPKAGS